MLLYQGKALEFPRIEYPRIDRSLRDGNPWLEMRWVSLLSAFQVPAQPGCYRDCYRYAYDRRDASPFPKLADVPDTEEHERDDKENSRNGWDRKRMQFPIIRVLLVAFIDCFWDNRSLLFRRSFSTVLFCIKHESNSKVWQLTSSGTSSITNFSMI